MVKIGVKKDAYDAIRSATVVAAKVSKLDKKIGTLEAGKLQYLEATLQHGGSDARTGPLALPEDHQADVRGRARPIISCAAA